MGKASSAKKVAKAQKAGSSGRASTERKLGFPLAVGLVVVLGLGLLVFVRLTTTSETAVAPRLGGQDHWHMPYGIYLCDTFAPDQSDTLGNAMGIHVEGTSDTVHVHPSSSNAAGENATYGVYADEIGLDLSDDSFTLANGDSYTTGEDCNGEEGVVRLLKWAAGDANGEPEVIESDYRDVRFLGDGEVYALVFAPADADIPIPPAAAELVSAAGQNGSPGPAPGEDPISVSIPEEVESDSGPAVTVEEAPDTTAAPTE